MGTISINSTSMFYFAVASIFILCTILKNQSLDVSSNSKITFNFSVFLMVQAVLVGIFALLDFFKEKTVFSNQMGFDIVYASVGFIIGYVSYATPFILFVLLKVHAYGTHFMNDKLRHFIYFAFVLTSFIYVYKATHIIYAFSRDHGMTFSDSDWIFLVFIPIVKLSFFLLAAKDLNRFLKDLCEGSIVSRRASLFLRIVFVGGPFILIQLGWYFILPCMLGILVCMVFVMQLISQDRAVSVDFLTGLNNRKELMRYLGRLFEKTDELDQNLGLIFIDINDFKGINDTYGHNQGDKALLTVASCLKKAAFKKNCFICRYAGDEFTVVLKESTTETAQNYINTLEEELNKCNNSGHYDMTISLSIGHVQYSEKYITPDEFIAAADQLMYGQKAQRKQHQQELEEML